MGKRERHIHSINLAGFKCPLNSFQQIMYQLPKRSSFENVQNVEHFLNSLIYLLSIKCIFIIFSKL